MNAPPGESIGAVAEEARRLVEAVGDWASSRLGAGEQAIATDSAACRVCPICQLIAATRGDSVDVVARFGEAWSAFLGVLAGHEHSAPPAPSSSAPSAATPTSAEWSSSANGPDAHPAESETAGARPVQPIPVD